MGRPEPRGELWAEGGSGARWWLADRAPAALAAREPPPGGELRPAEGTRCEKTHRQGPDPVPDAVEAGAIRGLSAQTIGIDFQLNLPAFILAAAVTRGARFFLIAALI